MRPLTHNECVYFRAPEQIMAAARAKAEREGMTVPELIRQALRREVLSRPPA